MTYIGDYAKVALITLWHTTLYQWRIKRGQTVLDAYLGGASTSLKQSITELFLPFRRHQQLTELCWSVSNPKT